MSNIIIIIIIILFICILFTHARLFLLLVVLFFWALSDETVQRSVYRHRYAAYQKPPVICFSLRDDLSLTHSLTHYPTTSSVAPSHRPPAHRRPSVRGGCRACVRSARQSVVCVSFESASVITILIHDRPTKATSQWKQASISYRNCVASNHPSSSSFNDHYWTAITTRPTTLENKRKHAAHRVVLLLVLIDIFHSTLSSSLSIIIHLPLPLPLRSCVVNDDVVVDYFE